MENRFDHIAFSVPDIRKAAQDFNDVFGIGWSFTRNDEGALGLYMATTDIGLVFTQQIDPANPSPVTRCWYRGYLTAVEVKVPDVDAVHAKMLIRGVKPVFQMYSSAGFYEYYYEKDNFYDIPVVVNEYPAESIMAVTHPGSDALEDYGSELVWNWHRGYRGWSAKGKAYPDLAATIPSTSDSRIASVALNVSGHLDNVVEDFRKLFEMDFVIVTDQSLGLRMALSDAGYLFYENIDASNPSPIAGNFGAGLIAALEVKVQDRDAAHKKLLAKGVKPIYELKTPGGLRAFYYDKTNFHDIPLVVTEYAQDSYLQAIDPALPGHPERYSVEVRWEPGYADWKSRK